MYKSLSFAPSETMWVVSAYQLTFASFLLVVRISVPTQRHDRTNNIMKCGRISDVYSPKPAFASGAMFQALTQARFVRQKIVMFTSMLWVELGLR